MDHAQTLRAILFGDPLRWRILSLVRGLGLPDCWIAAGFVRNAVWDHLHGRRASPPAGDVDVIWFSSERAVANEDRSLEAALRSLDPTIDWSVRNQARMHRRNSDEPYSSTEDAMSHWPETATSVGVRLTERHELRIAAPFGLDDLFALVVRPTPGFGDEKRPIFLARVHEKAWLAAWPLLRLATDGHPPPVFKPPGHGCQANTSPASYTRGTSPCSAA
jgi:hypothetical protein